LDWLRHLRQPVLSFIRPSLANGNFGPLRKYHCQWYNTLSTDASAYCTCSLVSFADSLLKIRQPLLPAMRTVPPPLFGRPEITEPWDRTLSPPGVRPSGKIFVWAQEHLGRALTAIGQAASCRRTFYPIGYSCFSPSQMLVNWWQTSSFNSQSRKALVLPKISDRRTVGPIARFLGQKSKILYFFWQILL